MDIHRTLEDFEPLSSSVVTIGSYDGLHRGHFQIINRVQSIAQSISTTSTVITFEPHPRFVIDKYHHNIKLIMSLEKKIQIFKTLKIDKLVILDFNDSFMKINAQQFMNEIMVKYFSPK